MGEYTPNKKRDRRMAVLFGVLGGSLLYGLLGWIMEGFSAGPISSRDILFLGDTSVWPAFFVTFWLMNLLAVCAWFTLLMYLVLYKYDAHRDPKSVKDYTWLVLGVFAAFGSFGGIMMTMFSGWVAGIEGFFLMGFMMTGLIVALMLCMGVIFGAGYLIYLGAKAVWPHVRDRRFMRPFLRAARYFNGEDEPRPAPHST